MEFERQLLSTLQTRLADLGYYKGKIDGVYGPLTSYALIDFKKNNGYLARDYPGILTLSKLFSSEAVRKPQVTGTDTDPAWMVEAKSLIGTDEWAGNANNPVIMNWAKDLDQWYPADSVAWCGLFVAHCMAVGAPDEPQDFNRLGAREWTKFGEKKDPMYGAIGVFWRVSPNSWQGHVGFLVGQDSSTYHILGGNQSDSVNVTRISKNRLLEFRGPKGWEGDRNLKSVTTGDLSRNEA